MPRTNSSQPSTTNRTRSRGASRTGLESSGASQSGALNAAADMASSHAGVSSRENPTYDEIAEAAYQRYLQRGGGHGLGLDDWLEAERELKKI